MQGFAPADEVLLFRQKDPKPFSPVRVPTGPFTSAPNKMAQELAPLKQPSPKSRFWAAAQPRPKARDLAVQKSSFIPHPLTADFSPLPQVSFRVIDLDGNTFLGIGTPSSIQIEVGSNPIPEPSTMLLLGSGLAGMVAWRFKKQQAKN